MEKLNEKFEQIKSDPTCDIGEHMETLKAHAATCTTVVEFGVRTGNSTIAFLAGAPRELHSYDIQPIFGENVDLIIEHREHPLTRFTFHHESSLDARPPECDLLFIDTEHSYKQLKAELELHGNLPKSYLIFHDTISFGGDLMPAINEFLEANPHWGIKQHFLNNNGLLILERCE